MKDETKTRYFLVLVCFIVAAMVCLLAAASIMSSSARAWDMDRMNYQIENTNVIVGGVCSGTIISKEKRLVLTAYHCVDSQFTEVTEKIVDPKTGIITEVTRQKLIPLAISVNKVTNYEIVGTESHLVKIVGSDAPNDIALLQVVDLDYKPTAAAPLAPSSYQYMRGQRVYAIGNPAIVFDNSITEGIISSPQRTLDIEGKELKVFQLSASIIGGNSGGSIVNDVGELIGTTSATMRQGNIAFAVPISFTKDMIKKAGFSNEFSQDLKACAQHCQEN